MTDEEWKKKTEKSFKEFLKCSKGLYEIFREEHDKGAPSSLVLRTKSILFGNFNFKMKELFIFWWVFSSMGSIERQLAEISEKLDKKKK